MFFEELEALKAVDEEDRRVPLLPFDKMVDEADPIGFPVELEKRIIPVNLMGVAKAGKPDGETCVKSAITRRV